MMPTHPLRGVVHGRQISVDFDLPVPDGTTVNFVFLPSDTMGVAHTIDDLPGFGAMKDHPEEMDAFDDWCLQQRGIERTSQGCDP